VGGLKSTDGEPIYNRWLELYDKRDQPVNLDVLKRARLNTAFPIIYCINKKDITNDINFAPVIIRKVRKEQYKMMNIDDDFQLLEDVEWGGDDGLLNTWSMYYKYPSDAFVDSYRLQLEIATENTDALDFSPKRLALRNRAAGNMAKRAEAVKSKILKNSPELVIKMGDVVLVPLDDVDRTKVDGGNLCGVVVHHINQ
jgi:hypothetical protein